MNYDGDYNHSYVAENEVHECIDEGLYHALGCHLMLAGAQVKQVDRGC